MLQGSKVLLRALTSDDLPRLCQFNNDVEVELAGGGAPPMPQALERLYAEHQAEVSAGGRDGNRFAIEADELLIGHCGLFQFETVGQTCMLGISIGDKTYWGQGYGREAIQLLLDYAFRLRNLRKVGLTVNGTNERAIRAYRACGFIEEGRLREQVWSDGRYIDLIHMGILQREWFARDA